MIVPTLGSRPGLLRACLGSIATQSVAADIVMVAPQRSGNVVDIAQEFKATLVEDPGSLAGAINLGARHLDQHHDYVNWLGDDDMLEPGSLEATVGALDAAPGAVLAYGACRYVDAAGKELWISRAGKWAPRILAWGPDLIPQPGMLVRSSGWRAVQGLDESYRFAFDLDLLLKLREQGAFIDVGRVVSSFRWHPDSLTVSDRTTSLEESERARRRSLSPTARRFTWLWERPVRLATRVAAAEVSRRARRRAS